MEDINCWQSKFELCHYSTRLLKKIDLLNEQVLQKVDINQIRKAIYYARKYHGNQMRQSGELYYSHPIEVAYMFAEYTIKEIKQYYTTDLIVTSILHDTIEDTALTEEMVLNIFGRIVASQVMDLTRIKDNGIKISSAEIVDLLFKKRKDDVLIIKIFDRLHNMQTIGFKSSEKIKKVINETLKHFLALSEVLELPGLCDILYNECYKNNIKLGIAQSNISIFDQPFNL